MKKKVAILGNNSFLAKGIIERFRSNHLLTFFGRNNYDREYSEHFYQMDFSSMPDDLSLFLDFDVLIYCAAAGVQSKLDENKLSTYYVNFVFPLQLISFLDSKEYKGRLFTFGSYFEIGSTSDTIEYSEEGVIQSLMPVPNAYCDSKRLLTRYYSSSQFKIHWTHLILPSLYGPGEDNNRLIPYVVNALINKTELKLSSGTQIRQYIFISDLIDLIEQIIDFNLGDGIFNVAGPDLPMQIKSIVELIYKSMNIIPPEAKVIDTRDQAMAYLALSTEKVAQHFPGWTPKVSIYDGILQYLSDEFRR